MKKIISTLLLLFLLGVCAQKVYAQFAIVKDTIRGNTSFYKRLGDNANALSLKNGSVVYLYPRDFNTEPWRYVDGFVSNTEIERGYVNDDMLVDVGSLELIDTERLSSHGNISFKNDSIRVVVSVAKVAQSDKTIKPDGSKGFLAKGKKAVGVLHTFPSQCFNSITVSVKGHNYSVPKTMLDYLFEPSLPDTVVFHDPDTETVYVTSASGDTDAIYYVLWTIDKNGLSKVFVKQQEANKVSRGFLR